MNDDFLAEGLKIIRAARENRAQGIESPSRPQIMIPAGTLDSDLAQAVEVRPGDFGYVALLFAMQILRELRQSQRVAIVAETPK